MFPKWLFQRGWSFLQHNDPAVQRDEPLPTTETYTSFNFCPRVGYFWKRNLIPQIHRVLALMKRWYAWFCNKLENRKTLETVLVFRLLTRKCKLSILSDSKIRFQICALVSLASTNKCSNFSEQNTHDRLPGKAVVPDVEKTKESCTSKMWTRTGGEI